MAYTLKFWNSTGPNPSTWNYDIDYPPSDVSPGHIATISSHIDSIYALSNQFASHLDTYGQDVRIGYDPGNVGQAVRGPIDDYIRIDPDAAANMYFFNTVGELVQGHVGLTIVHEIAHIGLRADDPLWGRTDEQMNAANFDFRGAVIDFQNEVAEGMGLAFSQTQTSYYATTTGGTPLHAEFTTNQSYSQGLWVDTTRIGTNSNNNIDHSNNTIFTKDLLFGRGGDDTIKAGLDEDHVYGGDGADTINGGDGRDYLYGEDGNDLIEGEAGNDTIVTDAGQDTAIGGAGDDLIRVSGPSVEVHFGAGDGTDLVQTSGGGDYTLKLLELDPDDITIIAGGEDAYQSSHDYTDYVHFDFVAFKINATGDMITFVDDGEQVGLVNYPLDWSTLGTAVAASSSPITGVQFDDGLSWSSQDLWDYIADWQNNDNVVFDILTQGAELPGAVHGLGDYMDHINTTYFELDPIAAPQAVVDGTSGGDDRIFAEYGNDTLYGTWGMETTRYVPTGQ